MAFCCPKRDTKEVKNKIVIDDNVAFDIVILLILQKLIKGTISLRLQILVEVKTNPIHNQLFNNILNLNLDFSRNFRIFAF